MTKNNETGWNLDNSYTTLPQSFYTEIPPTSRKFTGVS